VRSMSIAKSDASGHPPRSVLPLASCFRAMKLLKAGFFSIALLLGCHPTDPINRVVRTESSSAGFPSGLYSPIKLPSTASEAEVVTKVLSRPVKILTNREVSIKDELYKAVLVETTSGRKVVLIRYDKNQPTGWWSRVYED
jgi:hypothetical protein